MKLRKVMALTLAGTMALAAVGCGSDASTTNDAPAASTATETKTETKTETATETAQAQETSLEDVKNLNDGKLVIWTLANDLIDFGERFQEKTGVEVETVVIEPANYPTKVQTALLGGESEPDIIVGEPKMLEDFYDAGFFEDLDAFGAQDYADDFYDYNGYGIGTDKSGILLLVSMEARDWHITTTGFGIRAITDAGLDYISDQFLPYLSDGEYLDAFETYADLCDEFLTQAKTGNAYDGDHMPKGAYPWLKNLLIALGSGVVIALLIVEGMRRSLKSVKMQRSAENYVRAGSIQVTRRQDHFLYTRTSKSARPKNNSGSSGSSTHTSSSGTSHGGGGGKF